MTAPHTYYDSSGAWRIVQSGHRHGRDYVVVVHEDGVQRREITPDTLRRHYSTEPVAALEIIDIESGR